MNKYPNLYFIGGMRCGSTTIHNLLNQHPQINMSIVKEPRYWEAKYLEFTENRHLEKFVGRGKFRTYEKYNDLFNYKDKDIKYNGESSHYLHKKDLAAFIKNHVPDARIIISLRNPIKRLASEYRYVSNKKNLKCGLNEWINNALDSNGRVKKGLYSKSVKEYTEVFGTSNVHILFFEDLIINQEKLANRMFEFLGLERIDVKYTHRELSSNYNNTVRTVYEKYPKVLRKIIPRGVRRFYVNHVENTVRKKEKKFAIQTLSEEIEEMLKSYYHDDISELSDFLGIDCITKWKFN